MSWWKPPGRENLGIRIYWNIDQISLSGEEELDLMSVDISALSNYWHFPLIFFLDLEAYGLKFVVFCILSESLLVRS